MARINPKGIWSSFTGRVGSRGTRHPVAGAGLQVQTAASSSGLEGRSARRRPDLAPAAALGTGGRSRTPLVRQMGQGHPDRLFRRAPDKVAATRKKFPAALFATWEQLPGLVVSWRA